MLKKVLLISAFFIVCNSAVAQPSLVISEADAGIVFGAMPGAASACALLGEPDQQVDITSVHDGDTVRLTDGRRVRLIGINTPELARKGRPAQDHALQAKQALQRMLSDGRGVGLTFGEVESKDRYGRVLAHLYLPDGRNVQAMLLQQGAALAISVPPNLAQQACYFKVEQQARLQQTGMWGRKAHAPRDAATLDGQSKGFVLVRGIVARVSDSKKSVWLNLSGVDEDRVGSQSYKGLLGVRIARYDLHYFTAEQSNFKALLGKTVLIRGWVYPYRDQPVIRLRHPSSLELLN